ncbi:MAG: prepilin peptidase [Kiritimatiellae bacterium]|jgi:leader peptidase (prepilin peptidase)/N-methyltransferase|nr:prepilin peptidase [Kiritimatiellia bacterium]
MTQLDIMYYYFAFIVFLFGASVGSFLNVCIYRIPEDLSVVKPRSFCPKCKTPIPWYCNVPMLSYVFLGGKCKYCKVPISSRYFGVELLTALLFLLVWLKLSVFGYSAPLGMTEIYSVPQVFCYWLVVFGLVMGSFIDIDHYILPDRVTLGGIVLGFIFSALVPALHQQEHWLKSLLISFAGAAIGFGLLWLVAIFGKLIFKKEAMGFGDVKLMGAVGAFFGISSIFFVLIFSSFLGAFFGIACMILKKKELQSRIPFGPFIAAAVLVFMFWGPSLIDLYINMLTIP